MKHTTFEQFVDLAQRGTFVPVYKEMVADLLTPVSAFLKIAEHSDYAFLLESVEGGEQVARYSFLGKDPFLVLRSRGGRAEIEREGRVEPARRILHRRVAAAHVASTARPTSLSCHDSPAAPWASSAMTPRRGSSRHSRPRGNATARLTVTAPASCCSTPCWRSTTSSTGS